MRRVGALVAETLRAMRAEVRPGITTAELDGVAARLWARHGARSGPIETYGFPGSTCISVNEEVVHGVPGGRVLREGDLVTLDVTPTLDGFYADAAITVPVGRVGREARALLAAAERCLAAALGAAREGAPLREVGAATGRTAMAQEVTVFAELLGHGIGRRLHERPQVPNVDWPHLREPLERGLVVAIEPMVGLGDEELVTREDGWTIATADGSLSAHFEHTVVIDGVAPMVLTG
jgi:methionyl aminopeptidase